MPRVFPVIGPDPDGKCCMSRRLVIGIQWTDSQPLHSLKAVRCDGAQPTSVLRSIRQRTTNEKQASLRIRTLFGTPVLVGKSHALPRSTLEPTGKRVYRAAGADMGTRCQGDGAWPHRVCECLGGLRCLWAAPCLEASDVYFHGNRSGNQGSRHESASLGPTPSGQVTGAHGLRS